MTSLEKIEAKVIELEIASDNHYSVYDRLKESYKELLSEINAAQDILQTKDKHEFSHLYVDYDALQEKVNILTEQKKIMKQHVDNAHEQYREIEKDYKTARNAKESYQSDK